jgi:methyltransferase
MNQTKEHRFYKRISLKIPVELRTNNPGTLESPPISAELVDLTYNGALIRTQAEFANDQEIFIHGHSAHAFAWLKLSGKIVRLDKITPSGAEYGVAFAADSKYLKVIHRLISADIKKNDQPSPIIWGLTTFGIFLPSLIYFGLSESASRGNILFTLYVLGISIERIIETFLTSKERQVLRSKDDWTISAVTVYYIVMIIGMTIEFFHYRTTFSPTVSYIGAALLSGSFILRWSGMRALGSQWAIHAVGESRLQSGRQKIITAGPYKFIRHPIYLGVILELIAIPLIANAYMTLIFVTLVNIPLQFLRSKLEDEHLLHQFPFEFPEYESTTPKIFPQRRRKYRDHRRKEQLHIAFKDRRQKHD